MSCAGGVEGVWRVEGEEERWGGGGKIDLLLCSRDEDDFTSGTVSQTTDQRPDVSHASDDPPPFIVVIFPLSHSPICPVVSCGQLF